jgi:hypothetical protein
MGQYHQIWAFDPDPTADAETIDHYAFGAGAKLGEQAYSFDLGGHAVASPYAMAVALMVAGPWRNKRLVVIGDYAEAGDVAGFVERHPLAAYYGAAPRGPSPNTAAGCRDVSDLARGLVGEATGFSFRRGEGTCGDFGWQDIVEPEDLRDRVATWAAMADSGPAHVIASSCGEFVDPARLGGVAHPVASMFLGSAWCGVLGMLACSDGRGGGDLCFEPAGRWAYSSVGTVRRDDAVANGHADVSDWLATQERFALWVLADG